jgi:exopolysaccharide biosynthesis polyprenyl glycosylphosphotransferase
MHDGVGVSGAMKVVRGAGVVPAPRGAIEVPSIQPLLEPVQHAPARSTRGLVASIAALDVLVVLTSLVLAWPARELVPFVAPATSTGLMTALLFAPLLVAVWLVALVANGSYAPRHLGAGVEEFRRISRATLGAAFATSTACLFLGSTLSLGYLVAVFVVGSPLLLAERSVARTLIRRRHLDGTLSRRVLAVGAHGAVSQLGALLERAPHLGYSLVGCTLSDPGRSTADDLPAPAVGSIHDIGATCARLGVDTVMVTGGADLSLRELAWTLEGREVELVVVPDLGDVAETRMELRSVAGLPLLHVEEPRARQARGHAKRVFDVVVATAVLVLISPVMLVVAALIKFGDRGPVFYRQMRVGLHGEQFGVWKFRSMSIDAESIDAALRAHHGHEQGLFKLTADPRVTPVGRVIRRYSLDELPQLFNVLGGSMSLVGPRPHMLVEAATYDEKAARRLDVRPGMTGLWQVSGRSDLSWDEAVRLDLTYRDNWSPVLDLVIMARTVKAVLGRDGAY